MIRAFVRKELALIMCGSAVSACSNIPGFGGDRPKISLESMPPMRTPVCRAGALPDAVFAAGS